jgi:hypothetical protein
MPPSRCRRRCRTVEAAVEGIRRFVEIRKGRWKKREEKSALAL